MTFAINSTITHSYNLATENEWLETNGLGGWASSTIIGTHTRRYHGLLVAALNPPKERYVMLSKMDETLVVDDKRYELGCSKYANAIHPDGYIFLQEFKKDFFPEFFYRANGIKLKKTIAAVNGENTTLITYEVLEANHEFTLELNPLIAAREFHGLTFANGKLNPQASFQDGTLKVKPYDNLPACYIAAPGATFQPQADWYYGFQYTRELERGQDGHEDLFSYGKLSVRLKDGDKLGIIVSMDSPQGRDPFVMLTEESLRRQRLINQTQACATYEHQALAKLSLAADQFVVQKDENLKSIIAGYHWFSDWGRDTMIALPGLCLATGRHQDAKDILRAFAGHVSQGMIPNRFPDFEEAPEYNTIDASLWFFVAAYQYFLKTNDRAFIKDELLPVLESMVEWHEKGTRYGIHVDEDGLLTGGEEGVQLTWMDAKADEWVVTPRKGKCVEINALWYNVLEIMAHFYRATGSKDASRHYTFRAKGVKRAFVKAFWNKNEGYLHDFVDGEYQDRAIRPNQIFAVSLPFSVLSAAKAEMVLDVVEAHLFTPHGLRSLSPLDPKYHGRYEGNRWQRDGAYHQGTVWSWLIGPYIDAVVRVRGTIGKRRARAIVLQFQHHMNANGIGSISEIFDGEDPIKARGCIAQAWSIAELLRVSVDYQLLAPMTFKKPSVEPEPRRKVSRKEAMAALYTFMY